MSSNAFKINDEYDAHEALVRELNEPGLRAAYAKPLDNYRPGIVPCMLGWLLVTTGNLLYGNKPSYAKFKAVEIIARIPYQSWESATYTLLSALYGDERYAMRLTRMAAFSRFAQDNETMHVVVVSHLLRKHARENLIIHTWIPVIFAFFYFWVIYLIFFFSNRAALELNYLFECHAYEQYSQFLQENEEMLKTSPLTSEFLRFYGRDLRSEYEFFETVRNDELIHRNRSIREIRLCEGEDEVDAV